MNSNEIANVIGNLNSEIYNQIEDDYIYLKYSTNSFADIVKFFGVVIWSSDDDCRKYIDEYAMEDLEVYLRREISKMIDKVKNIKL